LNFSLQKQVAEEVSIKTLRGGLVYLRFDRFRENTAQILKNDLEKALITKPKGIILDLRYNGGGLMTTAQQVLDLFLDQGIGFYIQTQQGDLINYPTQAGDLTQGTPLVVLVGDTTISAAETVVAALQERERATLIGSTTHGKGAVIETIRLLDGSSIEYTVAYWLSPVEKKNNEGVGITPDVLLEDSPSSEKSDAALEYAIDTLLR
jgi:carboxyl-terminal processing protease